MQKIRTSRLPAAAIAALCAALGVMLPAASALAQSKNVVNSWDVDPNYHMNFLSNPCSLGYWNQDLNCGQYGYGYPYYGYYGYYGYAYPGYGYPR